MTLAASRAADRVRVEGPVDRPLVRLLTADGRWVGLNSRRDPLAEAAGWLDRALAEHAAPSVIVVIGAGAGYLLDVIEARLPGCVVVVLEPEARLTEVCRDRRDWTNEIESGRVHWMTGPEYHGASQLWRVFDRSGDAPLVIEHPVVAHHWPDDVARARALVDRARFEASANAEARARFTGPYLLHTLENLPVILGSGDPASLRDVARGRAAVIVAAGPSLDRTIAHLREHGAGVVLIAVDTALRPLLHAGIEPDLVVAVDPGELNARHLREVAVGPATWLLAEGSVHPSAFPPFAGRTFTFKVSTHHPWPWLNGLGIDRTTLRAWGSVLTTAFDAALLLGCDPLVFVGADLAYTEGRPYCRGTVFEEDWAEAVAGGAALPDVWRTSLEARPLVELTDIDGRAVQTAPHLVAVRDWLVEQARTCGRTVVNATGGGILAGGSVSQLPLSRAVGRCVPIDTARLRLVLRAASDAGTRGFSGRSAALNAALADEGAANGVIRTWADIVPVATAAGAIRAILPRLVPVTESSAVPHGSSVANLQPCAQAPLPPERVALLHSARHGTSVPAWVQHRPDAEVALAALRRASAHLAVALEVAAQRDGRAALLAPTLEAFDGGIAMALATSPPRDFEPQVWPASLRLVLDDWTRAGVSPDSFSVGAFAEIEPRVRLWIRTARAICRGAPNRPASDVEAGAPGTGIALPIPASLGSLLGFACGAIAHSRQPRGAGDRGDRSLHAGLLRVAGESQTIAAATASEWRHGPPVGLVPVRLLQREGLPPASFVSTLDESSALVVPRESQSSYRLAQDGSWTEHDRWPSAIQAAVALPGGGALAWSVSDRRAFLRVRRAEPVLSDALPFDAFRVLIDSDGTALWPSRTGGCWSWLPGERPILIADVPPVQHVERDAHGLRFAPIVFAADGTSPRRVLREGWRLDIDRAVARPEQLGDEGPCWSTASSTRAEARVFNTADLVRVGCGDVWDLLVPDPLVAAWAGTSLVVVTACAEVLLFERLLDHLRAAAPAVA